MHIYAIFGVLSAEKNALIFDFFRQKIFWRPKSHVFEGCFSRSFFKNESFLKISESFSKISQSFLVEKRPFFGSKNSDFFS